ncbi:Hypothetical predicted protein [Octopus vulgaris]|uniref:Uncharacterized protein n=1 Tax=Octopus vulgaris TaxID=6645 RepID=A0AA36AW87_OCTVU|nr:Hypothetical predicted protein [Octopus vulgaris]
MTLESTTSITEGPATNFQSKAADTEADNLERKYGSNDDEMFNKILRTHSDAASQVDMSTFSRNGEIYQFTTSHNSSMTNMSQIDVFLEIESLRNRNVSNNVMQLVEIKCHLKMLNSSTGKMTSLVTFIFAAFTVIGLNTLCMNTADQADIWVYRSLFPLVWGVMLFAPLIQAARVNSACKRFHNDALSFAANGYKALPQAELDSYVLFTSNAKLRVMKYELSLNEILYILEEEDDGPYYIFIESPEVTDMTDEDSEKEDEADTVQQTHHLSGNQLCAPVELQLQSTKTNDNEVTQKESSAETGQASVSGYNQLPHYHMHWSHTLDMFNEVICNVMRHDRLDAIMCCLHFSAAHDINKSDTFAKL